MNPGAFTYGAVDKGETNEPEDAAFDAENTYYLKDSGRRLTLKKMMLIAVPILAAILIMGGAALFLYRDFNHLYPGAQGDAGSKVWTSSSSTPHVSSSSDAESSSAEGKKTPPLRISSHSNSSSASTKSKAAETDDFPPAKSGGGDGSSAACWDHVKCAEKGLLGDCCPTAVGDMLFCCTEK